MKIDRSWEKCAPRRKCGGKNEDWTEGKADVRMDGGRREEKSGEWAERVAVNQKKEGSRDGEKR